MSIMSKVDPRKSVLERLQNRERNRVQEKTVRRWSAESGQDYQVSRGRRLQERKDTSPLYLPRLKTPPEWPHEYQHDSDLRRGKLTVVPPVRSKEPFLNSKSTNYESFPRKRIQKKTDHQDQWHGAQTNVLPPMVYTLPQYQPTGPSIVPSKSVQSYPPGIFPVPMYMSYAPVFLPQFQGTVGFPMGVIQDNKFYKRKLTRDEAAISIQKYFRGWRERKSSKYLQLKFLCQPYFAECFIDDLIFELLQEEIIPDLLIQILSHKKFLSPNDPLYKISSHVCGDVINEDINTFLDQIAATVFYSQKSLQGISGNDPLLQVCQELIDEVVHDMTGALISSTVKSLVKSHMSVVKSNDWLEDMILETIQPMVKDVATMALEGYKYESIADEITDEVTEKLIKPVIVDAWKEVVDSHRDTQILKVGKYAESRVLDSLFLEQLLNQLSGNNLSLYFRNYLEQTLDGLMCGVLLHQCIMVHNCHEDTLSNLMLKEYHLKLYNDLALDVVLDELCTHLDEDMQDLLEKEEAANRI